MLGSKRRKMSETQWVDHGQKDEEKMIKTGLVSVTFRKLSPAEIVALVKKAGQEGIEWGGDVHVPPTDLARAREVREMTEDAGLKVACYGSYYRLGDESPVGGAFEQVLAAAVTLGAPVIRVWAGKKSPAEASDEDYERTAADLRRCAEAALREGVIVATESHVNTLTETEEAAERLFRLTGHRNARTLWQPPVDTPRDQKLKLLRAQMPRLEHLHVYHWVNGERRPLSEGVDDWKEYLREAYPPEGARWALLEFVLDDSPERYLEDATTLNRLRESIA